MTASDLIKNFEGCKLKAYQDSVGVWTIGYGSTGKDIVEGIEWKLADCERRLVLDLLMIEKDIESLVKVPLTQNQISALCSFIYNLGYGNFSKSTLLKKLNEKDYEGAANEFTRWDKAGGKVLKGLSLRRAKEKEIFLTKEK